MFVRLIRYLYALFLLWLIIASRTNAEIKIDTTIKRNSLSTDEKRDAPLLPSELTTKQLNDLLAEVANKNIELHVLAEKGDITALKKIIEGHAYQKTFDINQKDSDGNTVLWRAINRNKYKTSAYLISQGANVTLANDVGVTPLHRAASLGNYKLVRLLVKEGADVKALTTFTADTALHAAVSRETAESEDKISIVMFLIDHGLNPKYENKPGHSPLYYATQHGHLEIKNLLLDAIRNTIDEDGFIIKSYRRTALHYIAIHNRHEKIKGKILKDEILNQVDRAGQTALHLACEYGHLEVAIALLKAGINTKTIDHNGFTAIELTTDENIIHAINTTQMNRAAYIVTVLFLFSPFLFTNYISKVIKPFREAYQKWRHAGEATDNKTNTDTMISANEVYERLYDDQTIKQLSLITRDVTDKWFTHKEKPGIYRLQLNKDVYDIDITLLPRAESYQDITSLRVDRDDLINNLTIQLKKIGFERTYTPNTPDELILILKKEIIGHFATVILANLLKNLFDNSLEKKQRSEEIRKKQHDATLMKNEENYLMTEIDQKLNDVEKNINDDKRKDDLQSYMNSLKEIDPSITTKLINEMDAYLKKMESAHTLAKSKLTVLKDDYLAAKNNSLLENKIEKYTGIKTSIRVLSSELNSLNANFDEKNYLQKTKKLLPIQKLKTKSKNPITSVTTTSTTSVISLALPTMIISNTPPVAVATTMIAPSRAPEKKSPAPLKIASPKLAVINELSISHPQKRIYSTLPREEIINQVIFYASKVKTSLESDLSNNHFVKLAITYHLMRLFVTALDLAHHLFDDKLITLKTLNQVKSLRDKFVHHSDHFEIDAVVNIAMDLNAGLLQLLLPKIQQEALTGVEIINLFADETPAFAAYATINNQCDYLAKIMEIIQEYLIIKNDLSSQDEKARLDVLSLLLASLGHNYKNLTESASANADYFKKYILANHLEPLFKTAIQFRNDHAHAVNLNPDSDIETFDQAGKDLEMHCASMFSFISNIYSTHDPDSTSTNTSSTDELDHISISSTAASSFRISL